MSKNKCRGVMIEEMFWTEKPMSVKQLLEEVNEFTHYGSTTSEIKSILERSPEFIKYGTTSISGDTGSYMTTKWWLKDLDFKDNKDKCVLWTPVLWRYFLKLRLIDELGLPAIAEKMNMRIDKIEEAQKIYISGRIDKHVDEVRKKYKERKKR